MTRTRAVHQRIWIDCLRGRHPEGSFLCAFSLVEVLVVVSIIALLVAILIPVIRSARAQTRKVVCQSNLRTIAVAWYAYLDEHGGRFPRGYLKDINFGGKQGNGESTPVFKPYTGVKPLNRHLDIPEIVTDGRRAEVFSCPGDRGSFIGEVAVYSTYFDYYGTSYRANRFLIGPKPPLASWNDPCHELINDLRDRLDTITRGQISNELQLILIGDYPFVDWQNPASNLDPNEFHAQTHRHPGQPKYDPTRGYWYNVAFMDGHADSVQIHKGIHVTADYTVIPYRDLQQAFAQDQKVGGFPN